MSLTRFYLLMCMHSAMLCHSDVLCRSCTPKQIDLQLQLPYCISVLLLTSGCKSAAQLHNTNTVIIWRLH